MEGAPHILSRQGRLLVADALLLTTTAAGATLAVVTLVAGTVGDPGWYSPVSAGLVLAAVLLCPLVVWRLHGRRTSGRCLAGAALGILGGGVALGSALFAVAAAAFAVSWLSRGAVSEGAAAFVLVAAMLCALIARLVAGAVRDLRRHRRHVGLDIERLTALGVVIATSVGALGWAQAHAGEEPGELLAFGLAAGVVGGCAALGAHVLDPCGSGSGTAPQAPAAGEDPHATHGTP